MRLGLGVRDHGHEDGAREDDRIRVPSSRPGFRAYEVELVLEDVLGELCHLAHQDGAGASGVGDDVQVVGLSCRDAKDALPVSAEHHGWMRRLDRFRHDERVAQAIELAVERGSRRGPERLHDTHCLVEHPQAGLHVGEGDAHHLEFGLGPTRTDAEQRPTSTQMVERDDGLRRRRRMPEEIAEHEGAEPSARRDSRNRPQDGRRLPGIGPVVEPPTALPLVCPVIGNVERRVSPRFRVPRRFEKIRCGQGREL